MKTQIKSRVWLAILMIHLGAFLVSIFAPESFLLAKRETPPAKTAPHEKEQNESQT